jgi:hypothetical protein
MDKLPDSAWMPKARCRGMADTMVPRRYKDNGHRVHPDEYASAVLEAKRICDTCVVQGPCRTYGLAISRQIEDHGVYGGLSMEEREELLGFRRVYNPGRKRPPCGTAGGYKHHRTNSEQPCDLCRAYRSEYMRRHRQSKRDKQQQFRSAVHKVKSHGE